MKKAKIKLLIKQFFCCHKYNNPIFDIPFKDLTKKLIEESEIICIKCKHKI